MSTINSPCWCHDNTLRKELEQVIQETLSPAKKSGKRKRQTLVSRKALQEVVQGFWLVVVGLKRAFLVESVQLDEAQCREICQRMGTISGIDHVHTWYECTTASAFAVDYTLVHEWLRGPKGLQEEGPSSRNSIQIDLSKPDMPWSQPGSRNFPENNIKLNDPEIDIEENDPGSSFCLRPVVLSLEKAEEFPQMAGILLEYPVIYVSVNQKPGGGTYLDGTPLILVRVWLTRDDVQIEQLLSFTYPQVLAISHAKIVDIAGTLAIRYKERLKIACKSGKLNGFEEGLAIQVTTEAITLDKVVL